MQKILRSPKTAVLILASFSLIILIAVAFFNNASVKKTIKPMVSKRPERVSELYFSDYKAIPKQLEANHLYQVNFTVTNHEYRRKNYTYEATMVENNISTVIATESFFLNNNQSLQQQIQFRPAKKNAQIKIIVLLNGKQEIRFKAKT